MIFLNENETEMNDSILKQIDSRIDQLTKLDLIEKLKPKFSIDGDQYCYLYGESLQEGIAGFGSTANEAMGAFYLAFHNEKIN